MSRSSRPTVYHPAENPPTAPPTSREIGFVLRPDAASVLRPLDRATELFGHYNKVHPHKALGYPLPREFGKRLVGMPTENGVGAGASTA